MAPRLGPCIGRAFERIYVRPSTLGSLAITLLVTTSAFIARKQDLGACGSSKVGEFKVINYIFNSITADYGMRI
jgi:hypothetical protein